MRDLRKALLIVWLLLSVAGGALVAAPLMLSHDLLARAAPVCEAKQRGSSCIACGLTTGFLAIGDGRYGDAQEANAASVPLYLAFSANAILAVAYILLRVRRD